MTKDQLLACLKPLKWGSVGYGYINDDIVAYGVFTEYLISQVDGWYVLNISSPENIFKKQLKFDCLDKAKNEAQQHYNSSILNLFNLEA